MHTTRLSKWGNSIGVRIPKFVADTLSAQAGDDVEVRLTETGEILITLVDPRESCERVAAPLTKEAEVIDAEYVRKHW